MTTANTDEVLCEDGETRPRSLCAETHDGRWIAARWAVNVCGAVCHQDDDDICYVSRRDGWFWTCDCTVVGDEWEHDDDTCPCHICSEIIATEDHCTGPGGRRLCDDCYRDEVAVCPECGCEQWRDECDFDEDGYCQDCQSPRLISNYSDKSANHLRSETKDRLRFGIELEVEGYDSDEQAAEYIRTLLPSTYCTLKHDGSLGENGVEIVTRPDSVAVHKRIWGGFFQDSPGKALSSWNTGRCGMHVHVSRAALSQLQVGKMMCFLNEPAAVNFVSKIAGRAPCSWCKVHKKKPSDVRYERDRYSALNVTGSKTVEFRIFKGTLAESGFMKNLEFVQALVEFTAPGSRSIAEATSYRAFCEWLRRKDYPHLYDFLRRKGFVRRRAA